MKDFKKGDKELIIISLEEISKVEESHKDKIDRLKAYLTQWQGHKFSAEPLGRIYLIVNPPDSDGFTSAMTIDDLTEYHPSFRTSNGGDWCRSDTSYLGQRYEILRVKKGGRIYSVKLEGKNKGKVINQGIRADIAQEISKKRCVILDVGQQVEVDHKNGKKDEHYMNDFESQSIADFQPLSKAANDAKREHCKKCKKTRKRYDAKRLGYKESFTKGDENTDNCQGCYWYDPFKFNQEISENFIKNK